MSDIVITGAKRTTKGKQAAKALRRAVASGYLGRKWEIHFDRFGSKATTTRFMPPMSRISARLRGVKRTVKITDLQFDRISRRALHVDLLAKK